RRAEGLAATAPDRALACLAEATRLCPQLPEVHAATARIEASRPGGIGTEAAIAAFERALAIDPGVTANLRGLCDSLKATQPASAVRERLELAHLVAPDSAPILWLLKLAAEAETDDGVLKLMALQLVMFADPAR